MLEQERSVASGIARGWSSAGTVRGRPERRRVSLAAYRGGRPWRWAAVPFGIVYLVLLALQFRSVVVTSNLDADTVSAQVIGQLFGAAPAHANVVLGEFGWYATLLFELGTKWLPLHREIWELAPYAMALAGAALTAWSVWLLAGRWAASLTAVLLICASPVTLHLLLSMTQHAPDWFCLGLLGAFVVLLELRGSTLRWRTLALMTLVVGAVVGVNAASDPLLVIAGLLPLVLALLAGYVHRRGADGVRALQVGFSTIAIVAIVWAITSAVMSALSVSPEHGLNTTGFATGDKIGFNFKLWWQSIAVLGNGGFFGRNLNFTSTLAAACAVLSIVAVVLLPRVGWLELRARGSGHSSSPAPARLAFMVFWCSSALLLSIAFVLSANPVDIGAARYLIGLIYAVAAVIPVIAGGRLFSEAVAVAGTCLFALSGVISMAQGTVRPKMVGSLSTGVIRQIAQVARAHHLPIGYAAYWDAAPITWAAHFKPQVYPVSMCDQKVHLCRFDLHFISSWYTPRPGVRSFLLTDPWRSDVPWPPPYLGPPRAVYHVGKISLYAYPYDIARKVISK